MKNLVVINDREVNFEVVEGEVFTTSLDIATVFEKEHRNILAQIRALPQDDFRELNFKHAERTAKFGAVTRSEPYYEITRDGFTLLAMSFNGEKFYKFKVEFINAFNKMEAMIRENSRAEFGQILANQKSSEAQIATLKDELIIAQKKLIQSLEQSAQKSSRLSAAQKIQIINLHKSGLSLKEIMAATNRSETAIKSAIKAGYERG